LWSCVAVRLSIFLENLVRELGTGYECEFLTENKGVVAVEQDFLDLKRVEVLVNSLQSFEVGWSFTGGMMWYWQC